MSNKSISTSTSNQEKNIDFSLSFLWHKTPLNQRVAIISIFILSISFAFGLGLIFTSQAEPNPIIIKQCVD